MGIIFNEVDKSFILQSMSSTYIMRILKDKYLAHIYYGSKINSPQLDNFNIESGRVSFHANSLEGWYPSLDTLPMEYPSYGNTDLRHPAYQIELENGTRITDLSYESHVITKEKPNLQGLPQVYDNVGASETLSITLVDKLIGLKVILHYTVFENLDVITRSVKFANEGHTALKILRAHSMSIDFDNFKKENKRYDLITLSGSWARERHIVKRELNYGMQGIESRRGASGHSENPFCAIVEPHTTEDTGVAYGFSLIYSGNYAITAEVEQYGMTRLTMGINPFDFTWTLNLSEEFQTPEAVMVYSNEGLGKMSRTFHKLFNHHLVRGNYKNAERPVLINNWEATYFDFTEEKLISLAKEASTLGVELLVLDDGWFGKRNSDNCSLGDWFVNKEKLPNGLEHLAKEINKEGIGFGLWVEPEMVSPDSDLYRKHPDWCLHVPDRTRSLGRNQSILDYSRKDVREYIVTVLSEVFDSANIVYVKWDMNRNMSEIGSAILPSHMQKEVAHRYILGVYEVMETLTSNYPHILFESCSGGGGRFDPGILYYMPQNWTSDDTDGVERLMIQYGTSLVYPTSAMTCHVSASPNHQTGRDASIDFRGHVAMAGNFGYELDITSMSDDEKNDMKHQVDTYKTIRRLVQYGDLYRLLSPFDGQFTSWMYVSEDKEEAVFFMYKVLTVPNDGLYRVKLNGLCKDSMYQVNDKVISGEQLMNYGISLPNEFVHYGDKKSIMYHLKQVK